MAKRKTTHKRRKKPVKKNSFILKLIVIILITLISTLIAYFILLKDFNKEISEITTKNEKIIEKKDDNAFLVKDNGKSKIKNEPNVDKFEEYTKDLEKEYLDHIEPVKKNIDEKVFDDIKKKLENKPEIVEKIDKNIEKNIEEVITKDSRPMLAIVIDDVTLQSQVNKIKDIGYRVNMAFMPPTSNHKNSAKIAQSIENAIVHFPLQASITRFEEENTLKVGDSYEKIEQRVKKVREQYPNVKYTNNHTGSVFTSDEASMDMFIQALKKYDFQFIDSRTTSNSVAKKYTKKHNMPYISRNIFLDNNKDYNYIQTQLKKAIEISKKHGSSIAIGHPYPITMKVLKESKDLLKDINLVYINQLPIN